MSNNPFLSNPAFEKLNEDARKSVSQAFDAMENWRSQLNDLGEKNSEAVFDKLSEAAKSLGWPTDYLEMSRRKVQQASKLQVQVVDQMMDAWEKNLTALGKGAQAPNFPTFPAMPNFPGFSPPSSGASPFPGFGDMSATPMMPLQLWMQAAEAWQKSWQQAMSSWTESQSAPPPGRNSSSGKSSSPR
jgi:hypothetical protein